MEPKRLDGGTGMKSVSAERKTIISYLVTSKNSTAFKELFSSSAVIHMPLSQNNHFQANNKMLENSVVLCIYNIED